MVVFYVSYLVLMSFAAASAAAGAWVLENFFPNSNKNLTNITWAHAVNNEKYLEETLKNDGINMIEADVLLGTLTNGESNKTMPIMAHPPNTTSDLSLLSFLQKVEDFDSNATDTRTKGVKLDFKTIDAFEQSIEIVKRFDKGSYPIWINADILPGPINANTTPVDATKFLKGAKNFSNSILSIGWTTEYGANYSGSYNSDQINDMIKSIRDNNVTQVITFPVRAGLAAESRDLLLNLTNEINNSTLTIWSSERDNVDVDNLRLLIKEIGIDKVYVDVPSDLLKKLHLDDLPSRGLVAKLGSATFFVSMMLCLTYIAQNIIGSIM